MDETRKSTSSKTKPGGGVRAAMSALFNLMLLSSPTDQGLLVLSSHGLFLCECLGRERELWWLCLFF